MWSSTHDRSVLFFYSPFKSVVWQIYLTVEKKVYYRKYEIVVDYEQWYTTSPADFRFFTPTCLSFLIVCGVSTKTSLWRPILEKPEPFYFRSLPFRPFLPGHAPGEIISSSSPSLVGWLHSYTIMPLFQPQQSICTRGPTFRFGRFLSRTAFAWDRPSPDLVQRSFSGA